MRRISTRWWKLFLEYGERVDFTPIFQVVRPNVYAFFPPIFTKCNNLFQCHVFRLDGLLICNWFRFLVGVDGFGVQNTFKTNICFADVVLHPKYSLYGDINSCLLFALTKTSLNKSFRSIDPPTWNPPALISFLYDKILLGEGITADDHRDPKSLVKGAFLFH